MIRGEMMKRRKRYKISKFWGSTQMFWMIAGGWIIVKAIQFVPETIAFIFIPLLLWGFLVGLLALDILTLEGGAKMEKIKRLLGLHVVNMKLSAIANYLKVKFVHVPESYRCEEIEKAAKQ